MPNAKPETPKPLTGARPETPSTVRLSGVTLAFAILFLFVLLGIAIFLVLGTSGDFKPPHWVSLYVLVALVAGLGFWLFTGSSGDFQWKEIGIRLGGGAAIGMAFMLIAHKITPAPPPNLRVIEVILPERQEPGAPLYDDGVSRVTRIPGSARYIVEFLEDKMAGNVHFRYLGTDGSRWTRTYRVVRLGALQPASDKEENRHP